MYIYIYVCIYKRKITLFNLEDLKTHSKVYSATNYSALYSGSSSESVSDLVKLLVINLFTVFLTLYLHSPRCA